MFWKKIFFLAWGYFLGNIVHSVYGSKKKKGNQDGKEEMKTFFDNFLTTQKNFIADLEKKFLTPENREKFEKKKEEFFEATQWYVEKGEKIISEMSEKIGTPEGRKEIQEKTLKKGKKLIARAEKKVKEKLSDKE